MSVSFGSFKTPNNSEFRHTSGPGCCAQKGPGLGRSLGKNRWDGRRPGERGLELPSAQSAPGEATSAIVSFFPLSTNLTRCKLLGSD